MPAIFQIFSQKNIWMKSLEWQEQSLMNSGISVFDHPYYIWIKKNKWHYNYEFTACICNAQVEL